MGKAETGATGLTPVEVDAVAVTGEISSVLDIGYAGNTYVRSRCLRIASPLSCAAHEQQNA